MAIHAYLLDTNIISALAREPQGAVYRVLKERLPATACTSIVVASEIEYGLCKSGSRRLRTQVETILSALDVLPLEAPVDRHYGEIRAYLQRIGQPIGYNDLFIAAHARSLGLILVSRNTGEFERVPDLKTENWLELRNHIG